MNPLEPLARPRAVHPVVTVSTAHDGAIHKGSPVVPVTGTVGPKSEPQHDAIADAEAALHPEFPPVGNDCCAVPSKGSVSIAFDGVIPAPEALNTHDDQEFKGEDMRPSTSDQAANSSKADPQHPSATQPAAPPIGNNMSRRAVVSGALGSALEWFDFAVYGALSATVFPALFFSDLGPSGGLIASFATFGVGFLARPLGGFICGYLGDRYGRRPVLLGTFVAMGLSSVLIGLLPTGQGVAIAFLLVALRFIQGFSLGGEATGAQLMTMEHAAAHRRGVLGSFINIGSPLSQVLANTVLAVLAAALSIEDFETWGWRIPFLLSIALVAVGVYIRFKLEETPAFLTQQHTSGDQKPNGLRVLRTQPGTIVTLLLAWAGSAMTFYVIAVYGLNYMTAHAGFTQGNGFLILVVANAVSVLFGVFGGWLSDRMGRKPVLYIGLIAQFVATAAFFPAANTGNLGLAMTTVVVALSGVQLAFGAQPALFAEQFPTATRFTGSALALTLSGLIFAAPAPMLAAALAGAGYYWGIGVINLAVIVMSTIALGWVREKHTIDLASFVEAHDR